MLDVPYMFGIIYPDTKLGNIYYTGFPYNANKIYNNSDLGNINSLTLKLYDSCGELLKFNDLATFDELIESKDSDDPITLDELRHPLNKDIQVHYSFVIGVVEGEINKYTKLEF
jgi:hypothetical protein